MIETDRLILRPFREEDAADAFEYLKAPTVNCFACMKLTSPEEARKAVMERAEDAEYTFAIALKDTGKVIGEIDRSQRTRIHGTGPPGAYPAFRRGAEKTDCSPRCRHKSAGHSSDRRDSQRKPSLLQKHSPCRDSPDSASSRD